MVNNTAAFNHEYDTKGKCFKCGKQSNIKDLRPHSDLCPGNKYPEHKYLFTTMAAIELKHKRYFE